jgi:hypothetical protein
MSKKRKSEQKLSETLLAIAALIAALTGAADLIFRILSFE